MNMLTEHKENFILNLPKYSFSERKDTMFLRINQSKQTKSPFHKACGNKIIAGYEENS